MFCRYCGAAIPEDSLFCARCGKRLGGNRHPQLEKVIAVLRLRTPYPYLGLIIISVLVWMFMPRGPQVDYSHIKWSIEVDRKLDHPEQNLYQQSMSLVVENTGSSVVQEIPVAITARIEPMKTAEVVAGLGNAASALRKLVILQGGKPVPLVAILSDPIEPGAKRRYLLEGSIEAEAPFKVIYEVRQEDSATLLASYAVEQ